MEHLVKPSDAKSWVSCKRRVWFDNHIEWEVGETEPFEQLIIEMGLGNIAGTGTKKPR